MTDYVSTLSDGTNSYPVKAKALDDGLKNIANWSTNVTNCLTEIPQDIKLELNNGTLTLKAGSKVYVPNGFESDGTTPKFIEDIVIEDDPIYVPMNGKCFVYRNSNADGTSYLITNFTSGTTAPTSNFIIWYDITNNLIKRYNGGTFQDSGSSLPIAKITTANGSVVSIDQVFNGFGYIGSTVFALPGVKGLIPNGRNADGSLNNNELNITNIQLTSFTNSNDHVIFMNRSGYPNKRVFYFEVNTYSDMLAINKNGLYYVKNDNRCYSWGGGSGTVYPDFTPVIFINADSNGKITSFVSKTPFHALDYNDSSTISGWAMPSSRYIDLTLGADGASYTAPANGWFSISKAAGASGKYISLTNGKFGIQTHSVAGSDYLNVYIPAEKGDSVNVSYNVTGNTNYFRFFYAEGENV